MRYQRRSIFGFILLFVLATLACAVPGFGSDEPKATPTPLGDTLSFSIPLYTYNLSPGETVPGTRLHYVGRDEDDAYEVTIDGLTAFKRRGDSFIWNGVLAPSTYANYNLRITTEVGGVLPVVGPVELIVFNPEPFERQELEMPNTSFYFNNIAISYLVPEGRLIPGTTLTYAGLRVQGEGEQASRLAELAGSSGYPFLARGDSLRWNGNLRENIVIRYTLRVASINQNGLQLGGEAELWIAP